MPKLRTILYTRLVSHLPSSSRETADKVGRLNGDEPRQPLRSPAGARLPAQQVGRRFRRPTSFLLNLDQRLAHVAAETVELRERLRRVEAVNHTGAHSLLRTPSEDEC